MDSHDLRSLDPEDLSTATMIHRVMIAAYGVEAELLRARDFGPLKRTVTQIRTSGSAFQGAYVEGELAGVVELEKFADHPANVASLAVHPQFFRRGLGRALMGWVVASEGDGEITVSTGRANAPALALYHDLGFAEQSQWSTRDDIPMLTLRRPGTGKA